MTPRRIPELLIVGDSHADGLRSVVIERDGRAVAVSVVHHVHGLAAMNAADQRHRVSPQIVEALVSARMIGVRSGSAGPLIDPAIIGYDDGTTFAPADLALPLMFSIGELDARHILSRIPADAQPVGAPTGMFADVPLRPMVASFQYDNLVALISEHFQPLFEMLRHLQTAGVSTLALHSLPPPTADDARAAELGCPAPQITRVLVYWTINEMYREFCAASGIHFIDRWSDFVHAGVVRAGLLLADGCHVRHDQMRESVSRFYDCWASAGPVKTAAER